ncbi:MAG: metalloregulator ArsR/SmtB family transcription factor [Alphaproteobacteria bacterium]|nr:metalloregulator ArsR/SmtB family transcription factor [Alphaproteobacteria bacterium]
MNINAKQMEMAADGASELLKALANRHRLMLVCQLIEGERAVGELAEALGIRDSTVSQHLALLRKDGIVGTRREGQTIYYSIGSSAARAVVEVLYRHFCSPVPLCNDAGPSNRAKSASRRAARSTTKVRS